MQSIGYRSALGAALEGFRLSRFRPDIALSNKTLKLALIFETYHAKPSKSSLKADFAIAKMTLPAVSHAANALSTAAASASS
jgi:indole-3-glycerol phosphate synthase